MIFDVLIAAALILTVAALMASSGEKELLLYACSVLFSSFSPLRRGRGWRERDSTVGGG